MANDKELYPFTLPLNGKLNTADDKLIVGKDFTSLKNLRYKDKNVVGIHGMTKINSSVMDATYLKTRSAFQFVKERKFTVKGSATSTSAGNLVDSTATFSTGRKISAGDIVLNTTDNTQTTVNSITSDTIIDVADDIFVSGETYEIFPEENHILAQAYNTGLTISHVLDNQIAVPNTGEFDSTDIWTDSTGANIGTFSTAPQGQVSYCNGVDSLIWAGKEKVTSKFINFNPDGTLNKDYSEIIKNTLDDTSNVATLTKVTGTIDSYTKLLIHGSETVTHPGSYVFTDSSTGGGRTVTFVGTQTDFSSTQTKFGTKSVYFDGTGDYLTCADHADFDLSGGIWSFDCWIYASNSDLEHIYYQNSGAGDNILIYKSGGGSTYGIGVQITATSSIIVNVTTSSEPFNINTWHHLEIIENGDNWYFFRDGVLVGTGIDTSRAANYTSVVSIGGTGGAFDFTGYLDEVRLSVGIARHTSGFSTETDIYGVDKAYIYAGFTRPVKGVKFYPKTVNTASGTMTGYEWTESGWTALTITDGTTSSGVPLAKVGNVTFSSTVDTSKLKLINGIPLYWYRFEITNCDSTTTIYHVTGDCPMQPFLDIWDGEYRPISSFQQWDDSQNTFIDKTIEVVEDRYDNLNTATFTALDSLTTSDYLVVGFQERMSGIKISFCGDKGNSTTNTVASVYYSSDGNTWTAVTGLEDKTSENAVSFKKSGIITWNSPDEISEFKREIAGIRLRQFIGGSGLEVETVQTADAGRDSYLFVHGTGGGKSADGLLLYYYKIQFSATFDAEVEAFYVAGIPSQQQIKGYNFAMYFDNKIALCGNKDKDKNEIIIGKTYTTECFNGNDSTKFGIGDDSALNCGITLFTQTNDGNHTVKLFFKKDQMWGLYGNVLTDYILQNISTNIGCIAPKTLKQVNIYSKKAVIFQAPDGIYMYDNSEPIRISGNIQNFWDKNESMTRSISTAYSDKSYGFVDNDKQEYHWCFADGASTGTCNREFVIDLLRSDFTQPNGAGCKWFEIDRGTGKYLQCGISVKDTIGNDYAYGFIDTGYMGRLEFGTTQDGNSISHEVETGDFAIHNNSINTETKLRNAKLTAVAKTTTTADITLSHYVDSKTTVDTTKVFSPTKSGSRLTNKPEGLDSTRSVLHRFKLTQTTDNECPGFEPLALSGFYKIIGEDYSD